jgi:GNAT superfamily N-acetyltransferase
MAEATIGRAGEPVGLLWSWGDGDALPVLPPVEGLSVQPAALGALAAFAGPAAAEDAALRQAGHRPYVAELGGRVVAFGWSASASGSFGPQGTTFRLPPGGRYLWGFATVPRWRGRGIYPHLLQAILRREGGDGRRFWILHRVANGASARGIEKAGFRPAGRIVRLADGGFGVASVGPAESERARDAARALTLRLAPDP